VHKTSRNSGGVREEGGGGVILAIKISKFRGVSWAYVKFPPGGGVRIFSGKHTF